MLFRGGCAFFFWCSTNQIIRRNIIIITQTYQILNLQFSLAVFDMAITLLRLIQHSSNFRLCQIMIFSQRSHALPIIHCASPHCNATTLVI